MQTNSECEWPGIDALYVRASRTLSCELTLPSVLVEDDFVFELGDHDVPAGLLVDVIPEGLGALGFAMDDEDLLRVVLQRTEPVQQFVPVWGLQYGFKAILACAGMVAMAHGEQMQVVIAQDGDCRVAELADESQDLQRFRTPVDEIPNEP